MKNTAVRQKLPSRATEPQQQYPSNSTGVELGSPRADCRERQVHGSPLILYLQCTQVKKHNVIKLKRPESYSPKQETKHEQTDIQRVYRSR